MKIAFIGLGIMGSRMAANLAKKGTDITVFNRNHDKALALAEYGAKPEKSLQKAVEGKDIVFTMLTTPEVVEEMANGENGFLKYMKPNSIWADCSTVDIAFAKKMEIAARNYSVSYADTPVAGSLMPAQNALLTFLVGAETEVIEILHPFLEMMGNRIVHAGNPGMGASMKLSVNMLLAHTMAGFAESVNFAEKLGIDKNVMMDVLVNLPIAAPILKSKSTKITDQDFSEEFPLELMHKDLFLAIKTAYELNTTIPITHIVKEVFGDAKKKGLGREDICAVIKSMD